MNGLIYVKTGTWLVQQLSFYDKLLTKHNQNIELDKAQGYDIHHEIKSILNSGNACYHSVQNLLSSRLT